MSSGNAGVSEHSGHTLGSKRCVGVQSPLTCPDLLRLALAIVLFSVNVMDLSVGYIAMFHLYVSVIAQDQWQSARLRRQHAPAASCETWPGLAQGAGARLGPSER